MENQEIMTELLELIRTKTNEEIIENLPRYHESDIASVVPLLTNDEQRRLFNLLTPGELSEIFVYLDNVEDYLSEMDVSEAADIIEQMDADEAVDVLEELDSDKVDEIKKEMDQELVEDIEMINSYSPDVIGSKITTNYIAIHVKDTVRHAMKQVISEAPINDNIAYIFVLDENEKYYGTIELKDLIIARENDELESIVMTSYPSLNVNDEVVNVLGKLKELDLEIIPVLDDSNYLVGVITSGDIIEAVSDEMGEDYVRLGGLNEEEELEESTVKSVRKRIPWLCFLLVMGFIVSMLIGGFEAVIATLPVIVFFQSLILGMAGNSGTQSLAITLRVIADDPDIDKKMVRRVVGKEVRIGLLNGVILSCIAFVIVTLFLFITKKAVTSDVFSWSETLKAAGIVGVSLLIAVTLASCIGTMTPLAFKKLKVDPAVASGPLITTIIDVVSVLIYYTLAGILFSVL